MNVLKLLRIRWKQPVYEGARGEKRVVHCYIQYERVNHVIHQIIQKYGQFKIATQHTDELDEAIFFAIYNHFSKIEGVEDLGIYIHETLLYGDAETKERALFSRIAYGYNFRKIELRYNHNSIVKLSTKVLLTDAEKFKTSVSHNIPYYLELEGDFTEKKLASIIDAAFYSSSEATQILNEYYGEINVADLDVEDEHK